MCSRVRSHAQASGNIAILCCRVKPLTPRFVGGLRARAYNADFAKEQNMRVVEKALTFDDVLLVPAHSTILPREVDLTTQLTRGITLNIPVVSSAMDTVTEARLAAGVAQ